MQYLGGKSRLARHIVPLIEARRAPGQVYVEPFVGGGSVFTRVPNPRRGYDAHSGLINMWRAVRDGWTPPSVLSEDEWRWLRALDDHEDPLTAFAGFGCSFAGKWFGGYARNSRGQDYVGGSARTLLRDAPLLAGAELNAADYRSLNPLNCVVYCDPPYASTTGYDGTDPFDSSEFWETMLEWAKRNTVLVSEFAAPEDPRVVEVWSAARSRMDARGSGAKAVDRVFQIFGSSEEAWEASLG